MALLNQSVQVYGQIPRFLEVLRSGTAPPSFTRQFLKDIGFQSSNHHQFIPLLKGLGFLSESGTPTERYRQFLDGSQWKKVIANAVHESYSDIFVIKARPQNSDIAIITGKFKSTYNLSDTQADRAARTFLALWSLSDQDSINSTNNTAIPVQSDESGSHNSDQIAKDVIKKLDVQNTTNLTKNGVGLHYNIQIHLPASKDIEVYNAIFKSLREHIID